MRRLGSMLGLWIVRTAEARHEMLLGSVQGELYLLAFTNAPRATACTRAFGAAGAPFYVCDANLESVLRDARESGVRGFIIDYDASRTAFVAAHPLPSFAGAARASR